MATPDLEIETERLKLRTWRDADRDDFARLHADPLVMEDLGGPITSAEADRKLERYRQAQVRHGYSRWAVETKDGAFIGYVGVMPRGEEHPLGRHDEVGWRLHRFAWGKGYASEAALAVLEDASSRIGLTDIITYATQENLRSQAVMKRLGFIRDPSLDFFEASDTFGGWHCLAWRVPPIDQLRNREVSAK